MVNQETASREVICLVTRNPKLGSDIWKTWRCVVVSPDQPNAHLQTFILALLIQGGILIRFQLVDDSIERLFTLWLINRRQWTEIALARG
jgi:mRNA-degrading endonuclease toxin of MazEF toxin-antitoxin module